MGTLLRTDRPTEIVLVDDDPSFAREVWSLIDNPARFRWLDGTGDVLARLRHENPRLILLDLNLPRHLAQLDEDEGLEILKALSPAERMRVVVVTQSLTGAARELIDSLGVGRVYLKSTSIARLAALMNLTAGTPEREEEEGEGRQG